MTLIWRVTMYERSTGVPPMPYLIALSPFALMAILIVVRFIGKA